MERKIGLSSFRAFSNAAGPHAYQSTGLWACCNRYGLFSWLRRFVCMGLDFPSAGVWAAGAEDAAATTSAAQRAPAATLRRTALTLDPRFFRLSIRARTRQGAALPIWKPAWRAPLSASAPRACDT